MFLRPLRPRHISTSLVSTRCMSMSTSLRTFILYAPDKTDEGTFALRMSVRPNHLVVANKMLTSGTLKHAGAMQDPDSEKMVGSMIIYEAESLDAARKLVENDIYYTSGVWDPAKIVLLPFKPFP